MKRTLALAVIGASLLASGVAFAEKGDWLVRVRAVNIDPDGSSSIAGLGVDSKIAPEVDFSYFITKNVAAELILTYPQKHDVTLNGAKIGSFKHLPPTLTVQYHFTPDQKFRPYMGAGINYTRISGVSLPGLDLEDHSWGLAVQAGFDVEIGKNMLLNFDLKKVQIKSDILANPGGAKVGDVKVDPLIYGIGLGWKF